MRNDYKSSQRFMTELYSPETHIYISTRLSRMFKQCVRNRNIRKEGKIEVVPRDIQGEKSRKDTASSLKNWSQQLEHKQVPLGAEQGVRKGKYSLLACNTRCNAPWKPLVIRWRSSSVSSHTVGERLDRYESHYKIHKSRDGFCI